MLQHENQDLKTVEVANNTAEKEDSGWGADPDLSFDHTQDKL